MKLIDRPVKRLFAFGCSFTQYSWSTWPEMVAYDLEIPFYNYGKSAAGNQYIANSIVQANIIHKFNKDDLIMVSWTNVCREDRWRQNNWVNTGNIYTQGFFDDKFIKEWADPIGYMVRDFATINLVHNLLKNVGCQFHMFSMCDIELQIDQCNLHTIKQNENYKDICKLFEDDLINILPSFFKVLWKNNIYNNKLIPDTLEFGKFFSDGHPNPGEHLKYLEKIFDKHQFKNNTISQVYRAQEGFKKFITNQSNNTKKPFSIHSLSHETLLELRKLSLIKQSEYSKII